MARLNSGFKFDFRGIVERQCPFVEENAMKIDEIRRKCADLLSRASIYSEEHAPILETVLMGGRTDMIDNFEFFEDRVRVFCYERGQLVGEWQATDTEAVFLIVENVLYRIIMEFLSKEENLIKRSNRKYIDDNARKTMMDKAFAEIGGKMDELHKCGFDLFKLERWNNRHIS